jgi:hypothetical protein
VARGTREAGFATLTKTLLNSPQSTWRQEVRCGQASVFGTSVTKGARTAAERTTPPPQEHICLPMFALQKTKTNFPKLPSHTKEGSSQTSYVAVQQRKAEYVVAQQREEMLAKQQSEAAKKNIYNDYRTRVPWSPNSVPSCSVSVNLVAVDANGVPTVKGQGMRPHGQLKPAKKKR